MSLCVCERERKKSVKDVWGKSEYRDLCVFVYVSKVEKESKSSSGKPRKIQHEADDE